jgi:AcrR family transcriptional regulator
MRNGRAAAASGMAAVRTRAKAARRSAPDRALELAEVAGELFRRHGFHAVSLASVAQIVGLTAPAIYRHFPSKKALLVGAIDTGLDVIEAALNSSSSGSLQDDLAALADAATARPEMWVLVQREMRHLEPDKRAEVQTRFNGLVRRFAGRLAQARPDLDDGAQSLIVTAALATIYAPPAQGRARAAAESSRLLSRAALAVCLTELPESTALAASIFLPEPTDPNAARPRSEELVEVAIALFYERGFAAVSLDDIGEAVGIAGPSIYHHFTTKAELLEAAFSRATEELTADRTGAEIPDELDELVRSYVHLGVTHRELFGVLIWETMNLPVEARRRINSALSADVDAWTSALRMERPDLSPANGRALVLAARGMVNDVVRIGDLYARPMIVDELASLAHAALGASEGTT